MKKILTISLITILALTIAASAFAAGKKTADQKYDFAVGAQYGLGDSGFGFVFDYSGENMWNLPLILRGFYHSGSGNVNYVGATSSYTNSVFGLADLYEFRNLDNGFIPYVGIGFQFQSINAVVPGLGTISGNGDTVFYTVGVKYNMQKNIALDLSYSNAGQATLAIAGLPNYSTNGAGITLGALYEF